MNLHMGRVYGKTGDWKNAYLNYAGSVWLPPPTRAESRDDRAMEEYRTISRVRKRAEVAEPGADSYVPASKLLKADWDERALDAFGTAARMRPEYAACMVLGEICMRYSNLHSAIGQFERALEIMEEGAPPEHLESAYAHLVACAFQCGLFRKMLHYSEKALRRGVKNKTIDKYRDGVPSARGDDPEDDDQASRGWTRPDWRQGTRRGTGPVRRRRRSAGGSAANPGTGDPGDAAEPPDLFI